MRLLLTSAGVRTEPLVAALEELNGRPLANSAAAVVPTAANVIDGDKGWLIDDYVALQRAGFAQVDIVDVSALDRAVWAPRLEAADVLVVTGGDTSHLLRWLRWSGLADQLPDLLRDRLYVGISAGSMVTGPHLALSMSEKSQPGDDVGLGLVEFLVQPHLGSPHFPLSDEDRLRETARGLPEAVYGLDDATAVVVDDGRVRVVGEGRHVLVA